MCDREFLPVTDPQCCAFLPEGESRLSNNPHGQGDNHQGGIEPVKVPLMRNEITLPSLRELHDTIYSANENRNVRDQHSRNEDLEFLGLWPGGGESLAAGIGSGAEPEQEDDY